MSLVGKKPIAGKTKFHLISKNNTLKSLFNNLTEFCLRNPLYMEWIFFMMFTRADCPTAWAKIGLSDGRHTKIFPSIRGMSTSLFVRQSVVRPRSGLTYYSTDTMTESERIISLFDGHPRKYRLKYTCDVRRDEDRSLHTHWSSTYQRHTPNRWWKARTVMSPEDELTPTQGITTAQPDAWENYFSAFYQLRNF